MNSDNLNRIALVTGANRGIGFETAKQLCQRGFHVVVAGRNDSSGHEAVQAIKANGGTATFLLLDVSSSESTKAAARDFAKIGDRLEVLINNAGIYPDEGLSILTIPRDQMVGTFQTNTFGPLEEMQAFLPYLKKASAPRVINVSSG